LWFGDLFRQGVLVSAALFDRRFPSIGNWAAKVYATYSNYRFKYFMRENYSIGELGQQTGCQVVTIRYYEKIGILPEPGRSAGGHRIYGAAHLERLTFIRKARELGITLDTVRSLLSLSEGPEGKPCADVDRIAARHLGQVREKIVDLRALEAKLVGLLDRCGRTTVEECLVLDALRDDARFTVAN
jgi:MerR family mercuric resistance operon transcriptional regulator